MIETNQIIFVIVKKIIPWFIFDTIWWVNNTCFFLFSFSTTKYSAAAAAVFVAANLNKLPEGISFSLAYLAIVTVFIVFRIAYLVMHIHDPLKPIENLIASILLGGK